MNKTKVKPVISPDKPLTVKQRKFVAGVVQGKSQTQAYKDAYNTKAKDNVVAVQASATVKKVNVRKAIDQALDKLQLSPEFAVSNIGKVAKQQVNDRNGAQVLKANEMILKLHGWKEDKRPDTTVNISNSFFADKRNTKIVDLE